MKQGWLCWVWPLVLGAWASGCSLDVRDVSAQGALARSWCETARRCQFGNDACEYDLMKNRAEAFDSSKAQECGEALEALACGQPMPEPCTVLESMCFGPSSRCFPAPGEPLGQGGSGGAPGQGGSTSAAGSTGTAGSASTCSQCSSLVKRCSQVSLSSCQDRCSEPRCLECAQASLSCPATSACLNGCREPCGALLSCCLQPENKSLSLCQSPGTLKDETCFENLRSLHASGRCVGGSPPS